MEVLKPKNKMSYQEPITWLPAKMEAEVDTLCLLAQPKGQQQFKNKNQPELTEN